MSEQIIVIGGGGHAKVVIDCIRANGDTVIGILDDNLSPGDRVLDVPVLGCISDYGKYGDTSIVLAIGSNSARRRIAEGIDGKWYTVVHPTAVVSHHAVLGLGSVVMPNAVINAGAVIGEHCIINTCAVVEHDDRLGNYVHISPSAVLGGTVTVGSETHVGIGVAVKNNITICDGCVIGAGAVVVKDITECGVYVGVPARKKQKDPRSV